MVVAALPTEGCRGSPAQGAVDQPAGQPAPECAKDERLVEMMHREHSGGER